MGLETLDSIRHGIRDHRISISGRANPKDKQIIEEVGRLAYKTGNKLDRALGAIGLGKSSEQKLSDIFQEIYEKIAKAYLRYKKKTDSKDISLEELEYFWGEIQEVISLFAANNINLEPTLLSMVMTSGGLEYWKGFFKEGHELYVSNPGIVKRAIRKNKNPRTYLRKAAENAEVILKEDDFADFHDTPWIVYYVVARNSNSPRAKLNSIRNETNSILEDPEFESFKNSPGLIRKVVLYRRNARYFLRQLEPKVSTLMADPELLVFTSSPHFLIDAIDRYKDPRAHLKRAAEDFKEILSEKEFEEFMDIKSVVLRAVVSTSDPRVFLRRIQSQVAEILLDPELSQFSNSLGFIMEVLIKHSDARKFLVNAKGEIEKIKADNGLIGFTEPWMLYRALTRSKKPHQYMLNAKTEFDSILMEDEFRCLANRSNLVIQAVMYHKDPRKFLRRKLKEID